MNKAKKKAAKKPNEVRKNGGQDRLLSFNFMRSFARPANGGSVAQDDGNLNGITTSKTTFSPRNDINNISCVSTDKGYTSIHPYLYTSKKRAAFTLAEVLITLGIIGVVAAMTMPVLIQKYNNHVTETRLKKFYSVMNQAIQMSVAENGDYTSWNYTTTGEENVDINFKKFIAPYLKISKEEKNIAEFYGTLYYLPDGSAFAHQKSHNREIYYFPKNPKKCMLKDYEAEAQGRCMFPFEFCPVYNGNFKKLFNKGMEAFLYMWDGKKETLYSDSPYQYGCSQKGQYCTAIIELNGWKIPKDYPRKIKF